MKSIEITVFRKAKGILSKRITLTRSGKIKSDGSACCMSKGTARRVTLDGVAELADLIENMPSHKALALGRLREGLPDKVQIIRKQDRDDSTPSDTIARTGDNLLFAQGKSAFMLLDHDRKGMPREIKQKLKAVGGFWKAVIATVPGLDGAARVRRHSTSSGLYDKRSREWFDDSYNQHVYIVVKAALE